MNGTIQWYRIAGVAEIILVAAIWIIAVTVAVIAVTLLHPGAAHADSVSCYRLDSGAVNCINYETGNEWESSPPVVGETGDGPSCVGGYITSQLC